MKHLILLSALSAFFFFSFVKLSLASTPDLILEVPGGKLTWNRNGLAVVPTLKSPPIRGAARPVWSLRLLKTSSDENVREFILEDIGQAVEQTKTETGYELFYPRLRKDDEEFDISVRLKIESRRGAFRIAAEIRNDTKDWTVMETIGPVLDEIEADPKEFNILWPDGLGYKIAERPVEPRSGWRKHGPYLQRVGLYPSAGFTMQYLAFAGTDTGLYVGSPDPSREAKRFVLNYRTDSTTWKVGIEHLCCVTPGTTWKKELVEFRPYEGSWHRAADFYRSEVDTWFDVGSQKPAWVDSVTGMFLVIMNQQNGRHTMWTYDQIGDRMCDEADRQGFNMLALFGWHLGGHDALFPQMLADELLGGREKLVRGIAKAQSRGKRVCLYVNGQLIDRALKEFWQREGGELCVVSRDGNVAAETWTIYDDSPGHVFGRACLRSERWYRMMLDLALDAQRLGADGILYDQLAVNAPLPCWSNQHGHARPAMTHGVSGALLMERIDREMKKISPEFIVLTEGFNDASVDSCAYYHGIGYGTYGTQSLSGILNDRDNRSVDAPFRQFFRYTYPEIPITMRNPLPLQHPRMTNMAAVLGMQNEVEVRFPADVECLDTATIPSFERYREDHLSASRLGTILLGEFKNVKGRRCFEYAGQVARFRQEHAELLLSGRFTDDRGFSRRGPVVAKAFVSGDKTGILVWNPDKEPAAFEVEVPGSALTGAFEPGTPEVGRPFSELAPETLRLLVWEKN